ncbi:hypothetical protein PT276_08105 [Orbaceae bacterium ESL0721]|nr:hypothetical protein [Orbaceae bacterium ESL0721]
MSKSKIIETPGADSVDTSTNEALNNVGDVQKQAATCEELIEQLTNQLITAPDDSAASVIRTQIDALLKTKEQIKDMLATADSALQSVQVKAQMAASAQKKTDMSGITVNKRDVKTLSGSNVKLTESSYVISKKKDAK